MKRFINTILALTLVGTLGVMFSHDTFAQQKGTGTVKHGANFVDQDGDGICDNFAKKAGQPGMNGAKGKGYGKGNGTCTMNGTGKGGNGTGVCDGTGPKGGQGKRAGK